MKKLSPLLALLALPLLAAPIFIDLRAPAFSGAHGLSNFSLISGGLLVQITTNMGTLEWDSTDGIGIDSTSYEDDEVEGPERLTVALTHPQPLVWDSILLTDLFHEDGYLESGAVSFDGGLGWLWFQADPGQVPGSTNGELTLDVNQIATSALFKAPGRSECKNQEFAVAALQVHPTPEPDSAALVVIGVVLLGVGGLWQKLRRRAG